MGGGGGYLGAPVAGVAILVDGPLEADGSTPEDGEPATQWQALLRNVTNTARTVIVHALCARS